MLNVLSKISLVNDNNFLLNGLEPSSYPFRRSLDYAKKRLKGFANYKGMIE